MPSRKSSSAVQTSRTTRLRRGAGAVQEDHSKRESEKPGVPCFSSATDARRDPRLVTPAALLLETPASEASTDPASHVIPTPEDEGDDGSGDDGGGGGDDGDDHVNDELGGCGEEDEEEVEELSA